LAQSIQDVSLGEFNRQLEYKANWYGRTIHRFSRWFPSSKTCSNCGWINQGLRLKDREWTCQSCGIHHDRDMNAAINIKYQGKQELKIPMECRESKRGDSGKTLIGTSSRLRVSHEATTLKGQE